MTSSRSRPRGTCTTNTNQPRRSPPASSHGSPSPSMLRQRRAVGAAPRARGRRACRPGGASWTEADGAGDVGQAVVEAQAVVVEPAHVGRAALVALGVDALLERRVAHGDHPALAGGQLLVGVEAEGRRDARARRRARRRRARRPAPRRRPRRSAGPCARRRAGRPGSRRCARAAARSCASVIAAAAAAGSRFSVRGSMSANTGRARSKSDGVGAGHERERRGDDLVALRHADGAQRQVQPGGARSTPRTRARRPATPRRPARRRARAGPARAGPSAAPR